MEKQNVKLTKSDIAVLKMAMESGSNGLSIESVTEEITKQYSTSKHLLSHLCLLGYLEQKGEYYFFINSQRDRFKREIKESFVQAEKIQEDWIKGHTLSRVTKDEFKCPVAEVSEIDSIGDDPYVNKEYCESFSNGKGCKNIKSCEAYNG